MTNPQIIMCILLCVEFISHIVRLSKTYDISTTDKFIIVFFGSSIRIGVLWGVLYYGGFWK